MVHRMAIPPSEAAMAIMMVIVVLLAVLLSETLPCRSAWVEGAALTDAVRVTAAPVTVLGPTTGCKLRVSEVGWMVVEVVLDVLEVVAEVVELEDEVIEADVAVEVPVPEEDEDEVELAEEVVDERAPEVVVDAKTSSSPAALAWTGPRDPKP